METEVIPTTEYEPQTKEQNALFAAKRRQEQAVSQESLPMEEATISKEDFAVQLAAQQEALDSDIRAICQKYPDETARNVSDLGMEYVSLCACGVPAITAYENVRARQKPVPFIGDVKGEYAAENDFYTKKEVDGMSKQDIKKNYTKIRNSMEKW